MSSDSSNSSNATSSNDEDTTTEHCKQHQQQSSTYTDIPQSPTLLEQQHNCSSYTIDHTYLRSIEGILRMASVPVALIFLALDLIGHSGPGEWINMFIAVGWLLYAIVTITVEVFVLGINVHRLIDGIICIIWGGVWAVACILAIANAAVHSSTILGVAAFFSIVMIIVVSANGLFAMRTWRTYEGGTKGSQPIFVM